MGRKTKELNEIADVILKDEANKQVIAKGITDKTRPTPFGYVHNKILSLKNPHKMRKGELIANWILDKETGKRERFVWLGMIQMSVFDPIGFGYTIYYRPFVSQTEKIAEREEQLYIKQRK